MEKQFSCSLFAKLFLNVFLFLHSFHHNGKSVNQSKSPFCGFLYRPGRDFHHKNVYVCGLCG